MEFGLWKTKLPAILALAMGGFGISQGYEGQATMTIYYVPFAIETVTPITPTNIEERGRPCEIHRAKDIDNIKNVLRGASRRSSQKFSGERVRVKLLERSDAGDGFLAFVEKEGEVRFSDGSEGSISPKGLDILKKIIGSQCKP